MELMKNEGSLSVTLPHNELWYLARIHAPGILYGVNNPYEKLSEDEVTNAESETVADLIKSDVLRFEEKKGFLIDEFVNGMVFSCIHSDHMLVLKNNDTKEEMLIHFLPNWHLTLRTTDKGYELTVFQNREKLWKFLEENFIKIHPHSKEGKPIILWDKKLELATYLAETGKWENAIAEIKESFGGNTETTSSFLTEMVSSSLNLDVSMIYNRKDPDLISQFSLKILSGKTQNYWVSKVMSLLDEHTYYKLEPLTADLIKKKFLNIMPKI